MHSSASLRTVIELWNRHGQMEAERRFQGRPYPLGMCGFPFRLIGQGFFPGGDGIWRESTELALIKDGVLPDNGVVFLGNDFGAFASFSKLKRRGYENVPTWRHIKARIERAGIPREKTFFTNAIMGLREEGSALEKRSWLGVPAFAQFCGDFLRFQLEVVSPQLVVVMGPDAQFAFDAFAKQTCNCRVLYTCHPYADFGLREERLDAEINALQKHGLTDR